MATKSLLLTIIVGIFFLVGIYIPKCFKNKIKLSLFTTSLTFSIMLFLIIFDLLKEVIEILHPFTNLVSLFLIIFFIAIGFLILKILDIFIPEHTHNHHEENDNQKEHDSHLFHIGFVTSISLILHNMLEGISIYITGLNDLKLGFIMALSVSCHNIPLGTQISIGLEAKEEKKVFKTILILLLVFSSFFGALPFFINENELGKTLEGILLSVTMGMLLYISILELLPEIKLNIKEKEIKLGFIVGIILSIILILI